MLFLIHCYTFKKRVEGVAIYFWAHKESIVTHARGLLFAPRINPMYNSGYEYGPLKPSGSLWVAEGKTFFPLQNTSFVSE